LQQIIDNCNAGDAGMDKCPGLIGGLNDPSTSCTIPNLGPEIFAINSQLTTKLSALPGNNPVTGFGSAPGSGGSGAGTGTGTGTGTTTAAPAPAGSSGAPAPQGSSGSGSGTDTGPGPVLNASPEPTSTPTGTPSDPSGGSTSTSAGPSATPALTANVTSPGSGTTIAGWSLYGCFSDNLGNRVLSGITFANIGNHQVTNTKCTAYCGAKGFSMAGTEYGGQCFCGNALVGSTELADDQCNMPCEGDAEETCGGHLALTVYKKSGSARRRRHLSAHTNKQFSQPLKV
jgi:hypothetical protein